MGKRGPKRKEHEFINGIEYKWCNKCRKWFPLDAFNRDNKSWDNLCCWCRICDNRRNSEWQENNRERHLANARKWYANNRERRKTTSKIWYANNRERHLANARKWRENNYDRYLTNARKWRENNPDAVYFISIKSLYNLSYEQWNEILDKQNNVCAICHQPFTNTKDCQIEHCHKTDVVRGIVHLNCNSLLAKCNDDIVIFQNLITYLRQNNNFGVWYSSSGPTYQRWKERIKRNALIAQHYKCPICGKRLNIKTGDLDHNHTTSIIRGVIHRNENLALGFAYDDIHILQGAIKYLKRFETMTDSA